MFRRDFLRLKGGRGLCVCVWGGEHGTLQNPLGRCRLFKGVGGSDGGVGRCGWVGRWCGCDTHQARRLLICASFVLMDHLILICAMWGCDGVCMRAPVCLSTLCRQSVYSLSALSPGG